MSTVIDSGRKPLFYGRAYLYFGLVLLTIFIGFLPSYFSKLLSTDGPHHLHGIIATLWLVLLIVQPLLYRMGKMQLHRRLGWTSLVLAPLVVISGFQMLYIMLGHGNPENTLPISFMDFILLPYFLVCYFLAIAYRKQTQLHARFMACTVFPPLIGGLLRILLLYAPVGGFIPALNWSLVVVEIILVLLLIDDYRRGRIRIPYALTLGIYVLVHVLLNNAAQWEWWRALMTSFAGI